MQKTLLAALLAATLIGVPVLAEAKTYELDTFSFEIPKGCKVDKEKNRFDSDSTHLECGNDKELVFESGTNLDFVDLTQPPTAVVSELEALMELAYGEDNPEIFESGADKYTINNASAPYALATWTHTGYNLFGAELTKDVAGMVIAIKVDENTVALGQYIAPEEDFDKFLKKAEGAFESVQPIEASTTTEPDEEDTDSG